jgi:signal peptidase I
MIDADTPSNEAKAKPSAIQEIVEVAKTVIYALAIALAIRTLLFQPYTIPSGSEEPNLYRGDYIIVSKWSYGYSHHSILGSPPLFKGRLLFRAPTRGDIVVFKLPSDGHTDYIKRLIGLPGDRIQVRQGQVFINDRALPRQIIGRVNAVESRGEFGDPAAIPATLVRETNPEGRQYLTQMLSEGGQADNTGVYVVPPHCYFMMGDNRDNSADSRFDTGLSPEDPKLGGCGWDSRLDAAVGGAVGPGNVGFVPEENLVGRAQIIMVSWNTGVDEWHNTGATLFKPWTWFTDLRPSRFLKILK